MPAQPVPVQYSCTVTSVQAHNGMAAVAVQLVAVQLVAVQLRSGIMTTSLHPQAGGAAGLEAHLAAEAEASKPEYLRQRPKYYYYYEWMKKRIYGQVGGSASLESLLCYL